MNERIKELERQCWVNVPCDFDMSSGGLSTVRTVFDRKKFAELIVRDCCEVINKDCNLQFSEGIITNLGGLNQARELIKQHFGVDE